MHDNKVRLSRDVLEKAEFIAAEWGLKNARAAIEAVFRCYCDDYLHGRPLAGGAASASSAPLRAAERVGGYRSEPGTKAKCEALDALDELLAL